MRRPFPAATAALSSARGAVAEWSKALAWKVSIRQKRIEGSNPSRSASCAIAGSATEREIASIGGERPITRSASIELRDLRIAAAVGTYGPGDVVPDSHLLDLTLTISPTLVEICADDMSRVFDYDPLIARIDQIARKQKYETQEFLMTLIVRACADYDAIEAVDICLHKRPVLDGTGSLGLRLTLGQKELATYREV